jgi:hypothetical protein
MMFLKNQRIEDTLRIDMRSPNMNYYECIRLMDMWNYIKCGEYEPLGLNIMNRINAQTYDQTIGGKVAAKYGRFL